MVRMKNILVLISAFSFICAANGSLSIGTLSNFGDNSDEFGSGFNVAFKVPISKTCSILNKKINLAFGVTSSTIEKENGNKIRLNSLGLHMTPELNLPINIDFGLGYGSLTEHMGPNSVLVGSLGLDYKIPSCNCSLEFQYRQTLINLESEARGLESFACYSLGFKFGG